MIEKTNTNIISILASVEKLKNEILKFSQTMLEYKKIVDEFNNFETYKKQFPNLLGKISSDDLEKAISLLEEKLQLGLDQFGGSQKLNERQNTMDEIMLHFNHLKEQNSSSSSSSSDSSDASQNNNSNTTNSFLFFFFVTFILLFVVFMLFFIFQNFVNTK